MSALREEIKETISATLKEKLHSDADSVITVSQSMTALDANAQYWSDLSNKAICCSCRALELQLKMAEEKVNIFVHKEAPEEALPEAAREAHTIHFQLDQNTHLHEAGLMPEQHVRFRTDTGGSVNNPSREYGVNPIPEVHIARPEADAPLPRQSTPALLMTAQLDGAVVNRTTGYSGIQQMPEKSFLVKASVKMGNPPTFSGECNLEKFESWLASVLQYMSLYNLLGPQAGKVQLQFLGQCLADETQEWFYWQVEQFDQDIKHCDLESIIVGLQKWFMLTLSLNKVAVNYDNITQGSMTVQQLHQELSKLAKQMIELPDESAGARIEATILEDEGQIEEFDKGTPHPEEQQDWEDRPEEDDQQYRFDNDYETRSIDNEVVQVKAVIKASGYNYCHRLYGIRVREAEMDRRVSAVVPTGGKEQPVYDHQARRKA
ncbi:hypothetical protein M422DRAFT_262507 [Sphaerobolus stellatus SS14]|uniref:Uncharacterized protein n=1 Tax=Sphaerobolus stellatus (strain SS14) TaxID=990650 RepID=A0A0C9VD60_SPHS4|nr:hypothetical protein M422DRAFT_262507 [Sphaerobolus stellatus SS14]